MFKQRLLKKLLLVVGFLSVGLAAAGILLPILPTTPFLLLAAACFFRSSDKLYQWLITHKWFGHYIESWREHKAIPRHGKIVILLLLWASLTYSIFGVISILAIRVLLLLIGLGVTLFVLSRKTLAPEMMSGKSTVK
jgi:uncharacterized protein